MAKRLFAACVVCAVLTAIFVTGMNYAQDNNAKKASYDVKTFKTYRVDATDAVEKFDQEVRKWLKDHPNIEIIACSETIESSSLREIWVRTIFYRESQ